MELNGFEQDMTRIMMALLLGGLVGLEREISDKAAGLRTNILICVGACLLTIVSGKFHNDPARIAAQLVSGIGFLGAGAIMREGDRVIGLTTAATIWTVAAIGLATGYGHFTIACLVTAVVLTVQLAFTPLDILIDTWRERHTYRIVSRPGDETIDNIERIFREARVRIMRRKLMKKSEYIYSEWYTAAGQSSQDKLIKKLLHSKDVLEVLY